MQIDVEDIKKEERAFFKKGLLRIDKEIKCNFDKTTARVTIDFFEIVTDELLKRKSEIKKAVYAFIGNFRQYQFSDGAGLDFNEERGTYSFTGDALRKTAI